MINVTLQNTDNSPFHAGEKEMQTRTGKRTAMEKFGKRVITTSMPDQHRDFYAQLPFFVTGNVEHQHLEMFS